MAKESSRKRPTYEPNATLIRRLYELSGRGLVAFAADCGIADSTLRSILGGKMVAGETLIEVGRKLNRNWHELLSDAERARLGLAPVDAFVPAPTAAPPATAAIANALPASHVLQLPAVLADFTGRERQLRDLAGRLRGDGGKVGLSALRGMGGIGKTSLAIRAFLLLRSIVPDKGAKTELVKLAELCGHLPLGLRVAGDFLRLKDDWDVGQYLRLTTGIKRQPDRSTWQTASWSWARLKPPFRRPNKPLVSFESMACPEAATVRRSLSRWRSDST